MKHFLKALLLVSSIATAGEEPLPSTSIYNLQNAWTNQSGDRVELRNFKGSKVVIAMMYTSCHASCPMILADYKQIERGLTKDAQKDTQFVLVSFDHKRDTPKRLGEYAKKMGLSQPNWSLLTGNSKDIQLLSQVLEVKYRELDSGDFAHSNTIIILDEEGRVIHRQESREDLQATIETLSKPLQGH
jgi:protein SCO1/2